MFPTFSKKSCYPYPRFGNLILPFLSTLKLLAFVCNQTYITMFIHFKDIISIIIIFFCTMTYFECYQNRNGFYGVDEKTLEKHVFKEVLILSNLCLVQCSHLFHSLNVKLHVSVDFHHTAELRLIISQVLYGHGPVVWNPDLLDILIRPIYWFVQFIISGMSLYLEATVLLLVLQRDSFL